MEAIVIIDKFAGYAGNKIVAVVSVPQGRSDQETFDMWAEDTSMFAVSGCFTETLRFIDEAKLASLKETHTFTSYEIQDVGSWRLYQEGYVPVAECDDVRGVST